MNEQHPENAAPIGNDGVLPSVDAQRDVALAVIVLTNELGLDSDEALELLVARHVISRTAARVYRERYFAVVRHLRDFTDRTRSEQLAAHYDDVPPSGSTRGF